PITLGNLASFDKLCVGAVLPRPYCCSEAPQVAAVPTATISVRAEGPSPVSTVRCSFTCTAEGRYVAAVGRNSLASTTRAGETTLLMGGGKDESLNDR